MKRPQQKMSTNASSPEDSILFIVFWNMFMVDIKKKTKSVNKKRMLNNEVLHIINTVILKGCGRNRNMNIERQLFGLKLSTPQLTSTEV